jgi:glyoxylase-like metal-dependent hydrolase (beta-lactamase superfamily II)
MRVVRRLLVGLVALAALVGVVFWWQAVAFEVTPVRPGIWMLAGIGSNVTVVATDDGAVVVDSMLVVRQGRHLHARARELTGKPVVALVNTHYHLDHTHGNPGFPVGTKVVSTARTLEHLRTLDGPWWAESPAHDLLPNDTFTDTWTATYGGRTIRALHPGRGHTDGDLVLLLVEDRVLVAGDLFFNGYYPNVDLEGGASVEQWPQTLDRVLALDFDLVVPGHGPLATRADLERFRAFLASLWTQTSAVVARGGSLADARAEVDVSKFGLRRIPFFPVLSRSFVIGRTYEEASRQGRGATRP